MNGVLWAGRARARLSTKQWPTVLHWRQEVASSFVPAPSTLYRRRSERHTTCSLRTTGSRALDDREYQAALNVLSTVRLSSRTDCGEDKPGVILEVEAEDGRTTTYRDDFYACYEADPQSPFATGLSRVYGVLESLGKADPLPTQHDLIEMWFSKVGRETPAGETCAWQDPAHYTLDVVARTLSWELCRPDAANMFEQIKGARPLSEDEQARVLAAYAQLKFGASKPCAEMQLPMGAALFRQSPTFIQSNTGTQTFNVWGEEATCSGDDFDNYGAIVTDVRALEQVVSALAR